MGTATDAQDTTEPDRRRLDGWKEIASHFGRGVRTVQRWERDLSLPVRRIGTGRGQVTYAFVDELERWRESAAAKKAASEAGANGEGDFSSNAISDSTEPEAATPLAQSPGRRSPSRTWLAVAAGVLLATVLYFAFWQWNTGSALPPRPASAQVVNDALRVRDAGGSVLWEYQFDFPLTEAAYANRIPGYDRPPIVVADIDGDGSREVLFVAEPWLPGGQGLFCFNSDGSLRFHHVPARAVKYGEERYAPPWRGVSVYVSGRSGRPRDVWFVSTHLIEFPTLLEKLDTVGRVTAEYWSDGQIALVQAAQVGRESLLFVGAINNEFKGASLAILDAQHPSGSAPATSDHYRCTGCPVGNPLAFLVFPRLDLTAAIDSHSHVTSVFVDREEQILIGVLHDVGDGVPEELRTNATTEYRLDGGFRVVGAELGERLPSIHGWFERQGLLDHAFSLERDGRALWPVRRWDGSGFAEVTAPEARGQH